MRSPNIAFHATPGIAPDFFHKHPDQAALHRGDVGYDVTDPEAVTYLEAGRQALAEAMAADPRIVALGEDLGRGGVFGQYKGLVEEFGPERISDAPISEACIMGAAVGAAMMGTRPIVEMRFSETMQSELRIHHMRGYRVDASWHPFMQLPEKVVAL